MKRILLSLVFLLMLCAPAWATQITVSSFQPGLSWNYGSTQPVTLRIYVSASFVTSDGVSIVASPVGGAGFYKTITCSVVGTTLTVSSFVIPSTTDATPTTARYTFIFFQGSTKRDVLWSNYQVPVSLGTTISNSQLEIYNRTAPAPPRPGFPTTDQVQQLINAVPPTVKMTDAIYGIGTLSVPAAISTAPKVVGNNDPRVTADQAASVASIRTLGLDTLQAMPGAVIPLPAPGKVTLTDDGAGTLSSGTYKIGVVAVNALGGEGQFDPLGYAANNSITIVASHNIGVVWSAVAGAAKYHVYVWGPTGTYYQRYYETSSTSLILSENPVGPVLTLTSATTNLITAWTATNPIELTTTSPHGLVTGRSVIISGGTGITQKINSGWIVTRTGASTFTIPLDGTSFVTGSPLGTPVVQAISVTSSNTGGSLKAGSYYFGIEAEFSDGGTVDQSAYYGNYPVGTVTGTDTGSITVSWTAVTGATLYRVYVVSDQDGNPRTHTKYFTTALTSITVTGTESYIRGVAASQFHGEGETESSAVGIFGTIRTVADAKSYFGGDVSITAKKGADAGFQANRFDSNGFAGLSMRQSAQEYWRMGMEGSEQNFYIFRPVSPFFMFKIDYDTGLTTVGLSLQVNGSVQITSPSNVIQWLAGEGNVDRIILNPSNAGIGIDNLHGDVTIWSPVLEGVSFKNDNRNGTLLARLTGTGNFGIGTDAPTSKLQVVGLPVYANNAAALAGGLTAGAFYRTGADPDAVAVVH